MKIGNVEKVKSASNSVDAIMNFKLHKIEAYIETPEVTIRKVRLLGFTPMWTSLRFYVVYFTYFSVCFFDFLTTKLNTRESRCSKTTKYCLSLFSTFYLILHFAGQKQSTLTHFRHDHTGEKTSSPQTHSYTKIWVYYTI